jgi:hypothetical protein
MEIFRLIDSFDYRDIAQGMSLLEVQKILSIDWSFSNLHCSINPHFGLGISAKPQHSVRA